MMEYQEVTSSGIKDQPEDEDDSQHLQSTDMATAGAEPSHHARRPMNAFLIFCKRHRSVVKEKYPNYENRAITKILGEWWAILDEEEKSFYTKLAKEYKDAFFSANPDFKWYKLPAPPLRSSTQRVSHTSTSSVPPELEGYHSAEMLDAKTENTNNNHLIKYEYYEKPSTSAFKIHSTNKACKKSIFTPGKLADEAQMGGLSSLILSETLKEEEDCCVDSNYMKYSSNSSSMIKTDDSPNNVTHDPATDSNTNSAVVILSEKEKRLQEALTETTQCFESFDKSNVSSDKTDCDLANDIKDASQCYDSDEVYSGGDGSSLKEERRKYVKHQSSLSSDESQEFHSYHASDLKTNRYQNTELDQNLSRTSERAKKGKKYQEFMEQVGPRVKRHKKDHFERSHKQDYRSRVGEPHSPLNIWKPVKSYPDRPITESYIPNDYYNISAYKSNETAGQSGYDYDDNASDHADTYDGSSCKLFTASDFDLEAKIKALPSLSLEKFQMKKKELKTKKKNISSTKSKEAKRFITNFGNDKKMYSHIYDRRDQVAEPRETCQTMSNENRMLLFQQKRSEIIGSKKRKLRKASINRIDVNSQDSTNNTDNANNNISTKIFNRSCTEMIPSTSISPVVVHATSSSLLINQNTASSDLCGLATLAEVAAQCIKD